MAQASKRLKRYRRVKRANSILYRLLDRSQRERDQARTIAYSMAKELEARDKKVEAEKKPEFTMTTIEEPPVENDLTQVDRPNADSDGLEVSEGEVLGLRVSGEGNLPQGE